MIYIWVMSSRVSYDNLRRCCGPARGPYVTVGVTSRACGVFPGSLLECSLPLLYDVLTGSWSGGVMASWWWHGS